MIGMYVRGNHMYRLSLASCKDLSSSRDQNPEGVINPPLVNAFPSEHYLQTIQHIGQYIYCSGHA